jgi:hypothetical protein
MLDDVRKSSRNDSGPEALLGPGARLSRETSFSGNHHLNSNTYRFAIGGGTFFFFF